MLNNAIEKNKQLLRVCSKVAKLTGLFLLVFTVIQIAGAIFLIFQHGRTLEYDSFLYLRVYKWAFTALLLLGINQLIKCLIETEFEPNWILRHSDIIIYIYASFLFINFVYSFMYTHKMIYSSEYDISFVLNTLIPSAIFTFIKILIWIGIGLSLKRIVPIIQESKTLV